MDLTLQHRPILRHLLLALIMVAVAAVIAWRGYATWLSALDWAHLKNDIIVTLLLDGFGAALCLAGALYLLDVPRQQPRARWYVLYGLEIPRRAILLAQLLLAAVAVWAALALLFGPDKMKWKWPSEPPAVRAVQKVEKGHV